MTCFEQRCHFLFETYYLLNILLVLLSAVLRNDGEINVIDDTRVVKNVPRPFVKFERLLIGYISKCKDRLASWLQLASPNIYRGTDGLKEGEAKTKSLPFSSKRRGTKIVKLSQSASRMNISNYITMIKMGL